jgi:acyl transferase domain-containing protein
MSPTDPIAIIGIGCRYPGGAHSPEAFWRLLRDGVDAITEVPADRWNPADYYDPTPGQKGKTVARWAGFLNAIDQFDAGFFGLSPREAASMDPQQRLLLQTAWEAIEDAGETLDLAQGSPVGVFVGVSTSDYAMMQSTLGDLSTIDAYTACSSSLVALHLACTSLRAGECPVALVGGANVLAEQVVVGAHYDLRQPPLVNTLASELAAVLARIALS